MSVDTGLERPGRLREIRKETSECEVRAVLIWTESTMGSGTLYTAVEVCWELGQGSLNNLLNGHFRFTCDSEGGMTHYSRFWVSGVVTVGGRQVDGEATVIAEAFEVVMFPFFLGELTICSKAQVGATGHGCIR